MKSVTSFLTAQSTFRVLLMSEWIKDTFRTCRHSLPAFGRILHRVTLIEAFRCASHTPHTQKQSVDDDDDVSHECAAAVIPAVSEAVIQQLRLSGQRRNVGNALF